MQFDLKGIPQNSLSLTETPGTIIFTDENNLYVSKLDSSLMKVSDMVFLDTELDRNNLANPIQNKLYIVKESSKMYSFDTTLGWLVLDDESIKFVNFVDLPTSAEIGKILYVQDKQMFMVGKGLSNPLEKVSDIINVATENDLPLVGITDKLYIVESNSTQSNKPTLHKFNGTSYDMIIGGGSNGGSSESVTYTNPAQPTFATVKDALDAIFYVAPSVTLFSNNINTVEKGIIITDITLNWATNKSIVSQSINNGIGIVTDITQRTLTLNSLSITSNITYTITISDGTNNASKNTSINFMQKRHWGVSANSSLTSADILALNGEFSSTYKQTKNFNCTGGRYIYFAFPVAFGTPNTFSIGGLTAPFVNTGTVQHTNASGFTENYYVFRSQNIQNASSIDVVIS